MLSVVVGAATGGVLGQAATEGAAHTTAGHITLTASTSPFWQTHFRHITHANAEQPLEEVTLYAKAWKYGAPARVEGGEDGARTNATIVQHSSNLYNAFLRAVLQPYNIPEADLPAVLSGAGNDFQIQFLSFKDHSGTMLQKVNGCLSVGRCAFHPLCTIVAVGRRKPLPMPCLQRCWLHGHSLGRRESQ